MVGEIGLYGAVRAIEMTTAMSTEPCLVEVSAASTVSELLLVRSAAYYRDGGSPEPQLVRVWVYEQVCYGETWPLADFIVVLEDARRQIPERFRSSAGIEIESDYESCSVSIVIYYDRPETPDEIAARVTEYESYRRDSAVAEEARERAELERLKKKYG